MSLRNHYFVLSCIFLLSLGLRLYSLDTVPNGLHQDEVANMYIGRFILQNGQDIYGNTYPLLYVNKFGDYPPALPMYLQGASSLVFTSPTFASRFPIALIGSFTIFPLFYLLQFFLKRRVALIGTGIFAIFPWHIILSRAGAEGVLGFTFCLGGLALVFYGIQLKRNTYIVISWIFFLLSYFLYPSFRIIVPLTLMPLPFLYSHKKIRRILIASVVIFTFLTLIIGSTIWGRGRFTQTGLFTNSAHKVTLSDQIQRLIISDGHTSAFTARLFHNKPIVYTQSFIENYLRYYSPSFLFIQGGLPIRYAVPNVGLLFYTFLILLIPTFFLFATTIEKKVIYYFLYLLLIAPLPAAFTIEDSPNIHRAVFMIFPLIFFVTVALVQGINLLKKIPLFARAIFYTIFVGIFMLELLYTAHQYVIHAGKMGPVRRQDGYVQLASYLVSNRDKYAKIVVPYADWIPIYYLYSKKDYNKTYIGKINLDFRIKGIDNLYFIDAMCPTVKDFKRIVGNVSGNTVIVQDGNCLIQPETEVVETIDKADGVAFRLVTVK